MTNYFIVPGLGNSGPKHWQTFFEKSGDNFYRIKQQEWDAPNCSDWISTIDSAISAYDLATVVLIGHSLGCIAIVQWATQYGKKIKGALLVSPTDLEAPQYTLHTEGFDPIPKTKINFKTIVVASEDDPWIPFERAKYFADNWGSEFSNIGRAGHINVASGFGEWKQGLKILEMLG
ncbi:RBBP9/YdeN family alpha/beta hydrolase [Ferruginibacter sp.]|nr:alpha/beta hydrolase [Ferruginibacter sp.]